MATVSHRPSELSNISKVSLLFFKPTVFVWFDSLTIKKFYLVKSNILSIVILCDGHSITGTVFLTVEKRIERESIKTRPFWHTNGRQQERYPEADNKETDGVLKKASNKI
jgi:hypothetical protein